MLKLYHSPISPISRQVHVALLEKQIPYNSVPVQLNGEQFEPYFMSLNPFHHVPILVDDGFTVIESHAILDYLNAKYMNNPLLPTLPKLLANVRMAQMVTVNELAPALIGLIRYQSDMPRLVITKEHVNRVMSFLEERLGQDRFFGGNDLSLGDIVVGSFILLMPKLGFPINYCRLSQWSSELASRPSWVKTQWTETEFDLFKRRVSAAEALSRRRKKFALTRYQHRLDKMAE
jgi:glutathione S-transferase